MSDFTKGFIIGFCVCWLLLARGCGCQRYRPLFGEGPLPGGVVESNGRQ